MAHGACSDHERQRIYVSGGSAKASCDFGPGLNEMEVLDMSDQSNGNLLTNVTAIQISNGNIDGSENPPNWSKCSAMHGGRSYLASAVGEDGNVFTVGGCLSEDYSTAEMYSPDTNQWTKLAHTLTKRDSLGDTNKLHIMLTIIIIYWM